MHTIETLFDWLLTNSVRASILAVGILLIQWCFRHRLTPAWRHALWLPLFAALALPAFPVLPAWSGATSTPVALEVPQHVEQPSWLFRTPGFQPGDSTEEAIEEATAGRMPAIQDRLEAYPPLPRKIATPESKIALKPLAAIVWFAGTLALLATGLLGYHRNMRNIRRTASQPDRQLQAAIDDAAQDAGLTRAPLTWVSPAVASPAVAGITRPVLLLPADFPGKLDAAEVRLMLLHEFSHVKRFDLPLNWLACLLLAAHWFNPLVWFTFARMRIDREKACDARVLAIDSGGRRTEYGETLIKLQFAAPSHIWSLGFIGLFLRGFEIKSRIRQIAAYRPGGAFSRITGVTLLSLLMVFGLSKCRPAESQGEPEAAASADAKDPALLLEALREAIREQEAKVEERRKALADIVHEKGIIHTGEDSVIPSGNVDDALGARAIQETYNRLQQERVQLENQINSLLRYDSEQLITYAVGLNLPENIVKTLHPQYLSLQLELQRLKSTGLGDNHPDIVTLNISLDALREQMQEGIVALRATLRAQLDMANDRLARIESMGEETRDQAIQRGLDAHDYVEAKKAFETEQALLQQMRLKLIGETITHRLGEEADPAIAQAPTPAPPAPPSDIPLTIGGHVHRAGQVPFTPHLNLYSAIQQAGGATDTGNLSRVTLLRDGNRTTHDLTKLENWNTPVQPGDIIEVPQKRWQGR